MAITTCPFVRGNKDAQPCLILNKRSQMVRQSGDLCYPGGGIQALDSVLSKFIGLPGMPLAQKPFRWNGRPAVKTISSLIRVFFTTSLREAWEEMRLNPFRVSFLGALPTQRLVMFERTIQPMVAWIEPGQHFKPNWEVDRIVYIPLKKLFNPDHYGRFQLAVRQKGKTPSAQQKEYPCFIHKGRAADEMLWGASYRMTMDFLRLVFDFKPPDPQHLPVFKGRLEEDYLKGSWKK